MDVWQRVSILSQEARELAGINERFVNEEADVQELRVSFAETFAQLIALRESAGRSKAWHAVNIAITQLRIARAMAVESLYINKSELDDTQETV